MTTIVVGVTALAALTLYLAGTGAPDAAPDRSSPEPPAPAEPEGDATGALTDDEAATGDVAGGAEEPANLLTGDQHAFTDSIGGWTPQGNTTLAHALEPATAGRGSLAITVDAQGPWPDASRTARAGTTHAGPVDPGAAYEASWRIMPAGPAAQARCELRWFDAGGTILDTLAGAPVETPPGTWTQASCDGTAPAGTDAVAVRVHLSDVDYGAVYYVDDVWLRSSTPALAEAGDAATGSGAPAAAPTPTEEPDRGPPPPPGAPSHGRLVDAGNTGPTAYVAPDLGRRLTYDDLTPSGTVTTTEDGQVIERLDITGGIVIAHDDVVVRAVRIRGGTDHYSISYAAGSEATGASISYVEIDGGGNPKLMGVHLWDFELRYAHIYGQATGINIGSNSTVEHTYVHSQALEPGSHNAAISLHGGSGVALRFNNFEGSTSSALSLYPRLAPIVDVLVEGNLFNGGSYCTYAGDSHNHAAHNERIRYIDNLFGRKFYPQCGVHGPYSTWDPTRPGNQWVGNTYEDGSALD